MTRPLLSVYGLKWNPFTPDLPGDALWRTPEIEHFCWRVEQQGGDGAFPLPTVESVTAQSATLRLLTRHPPAMPHIVVAALLRPPSRTPDLNPAIALTLGLPD